MTLDEFLAAIEKKLPPIPSGALEKFEAEIGQRLPEDYREFLIRCNGGYARGYVQALDPKGLRPDACVNHIGGFRKENHFSLAWARLIYQSEEELRIPSALLWIMDDPCGNAICVGISGEHRGQVFLWDHELEPDPSEWDGSVATAGNIELVADSFDYFVAGLQKVEEK